MEPFFREKTSDYYKKKYRKYKKKYLQLGGVMEDGHQELDVDKFLKGEKNDAGLTNESNEVLDTYKATDLKTYFQDGVTLYEHDSRLKYVKLAKKKIFYGAHRKMQKYYTCDDNSIKKFSYPLWVTDKQTAEMYHGLKQEYEAGENEETCSFLYEFKAENEINLIDISDLDNVNLLIGLFNENAKGDLKFLKNIEYVRIMYRLYFDEDTEENFNQFIASLEEKTRNALKYKIKSDTDVKNIITHRSKKIINSRDGINLSRMSEMGDDVMMSLLIYIATYKIEDIVFHGFWNTFSFAQMSEDENPVKLFHPEMCIFRYRCKWDYFRKFEADVTFSFGTNKIDYEPHYFEILLKRLKNKDKDKQLVDHITKCIYQMFDEKYHESTIAGLSDLIKMKKITDDDIRTKLGLDDSYAFYGGFINKIYDTHRDKIMVEVNEHIKKKFKNQTTKELFLRLFGFDFWDEAYKMNEGDKKKFIVFFDVNRMKKGFKCTPDMIFCDWMRGDLIKKLKTNHDIIFDPDWRNQIAKNVHTRQINSRKLILTPPSQNEKMEEQTPA